MFLRKTARGAFGYAARMFFTSDARLNAYLNQRGVIVQPNQSAAGFEPTFSLVSVGPVGGFGQTLVLPLNAVPGPNMPGNPLLTPALALQFASNLVGE